MKILDVSLLLTFNVVPFLSLWEKLYQSQILVTFDVFINLELAQILHQMKIGCLLSCKADRPSFLFSATLHPQITSKGDFAAIHSREFYAMSVQDKAKVNLISNIMLDHTFQRSWKRQKDVYCLSNNIKSKYYLVL